MVQSRRHLDTSARSVALSACKVKIDSYKYVVRGQPVIEVNYVKTFWEEI